MTREAKKKSKALPLKFWNIDEYKKQYKITLFRANALVKAYSEDALVRAICNNAWLYSLFFPRLAELIEVEEKFLASQVAQCTKIEVPVEFEEDVTSFRQVIRTNNNIKSKLDE